MISLHSCKINDGSYNKSLNDLKFKTISRNKPKNMAIHVEIIGSQQVAVRRGLKIILPQLDKDLHGIELHLVPILSLKTDEIMESRSKQVAIKYSQIFSNIKTYEIEGITNIDNLISSGSELTLR